MSRRERNRMTLELWCLDNSINLKNPRVSFRLRRTVDFIEKLGVTVRSTVRSRSTTEMTRRLIKIKSCPFDRRLSVRMCPHQLCEEMRLFIASVGSPSVRQGESTCRRVIHQNRHLNRDLSTCLIDDPVDFASTSSTCFSRCARIQRIPCCHVTSK